MAYQKKENRKILSIECEDDYHVALKRYLKFCGAQQGTPEWAEAELLKVFIEEYEENECDVDESDGHFLKGNC